jgi:PIN domain nuclease of toxin-antitoxin system
MKYLLDTHVWIWLMTGQEIYSSTVNLLEEAASKHQLRLSIISIWEIAMLVSKNRLKLDQEPLAWVRTAVKKSGIEVLPISLEIAVESTRLPGEIHGDPCDRLILATARHEQAILITRDRLLLAYGSAGLVHSLEA